MKIKNLNVGQVVYISKEVDSNILESSKPNSKKMVKTVVIDEITITEISEDGEHVKAKIGNKKSKKYYENEMKKWRLEKPLLLHSNFGIYRLATKQEKGELRK